MSEFPDFVIIAKNTTEAFRKFNKALSAPYYDERGPLMMVILILLGAILLSLVA